MDLDLITIKPDPIEIAPSKREFLRAFTRTGNELTDLDTVLEQIEATKLALAAKGFTGFKLKLDTYPDDNGADRITVSVQGTRLETAEECAARVKQHTQYNAQRWAQHEAQCAEAARRKELKRLTGHLTIEQLQALQPLTVKD